MAEKEPQVAFIDRRKISSDGEIRPEAAASEHTQPQSEPAGKTEARPPIEMPRAASSAGVQESGPVPVPPQGESDQGLPEGPTAQETAESNAAYQQTTQQLDDLLRAKSPDAARLGPVGFEHLVQSMYMTAMMALGAGTQPGEKPRIDLMGARQTIDLLAVLDEKTKGNLTSDEHRLLESALFELRMMFLEITNAIARNAANPPQPPKR